MRRILLSALIALCTHAGYTQTRFWIATTASNWNNTANWSATSGGAGGASVPGAGELAVFNGTGGRNGNCSLDVAPTVAGITVNGYTGTLNLSGFNLTTTGTNIFTTASITNSGAAASLIINTTTGTTFNGTSFAVPVTGSSGDINFNGSVFGSTVTLTKTGATNNNNTGGNTFTGAVVIANSGTGELNMASTNPDIFNGSTTLNITGTSRIQVGVNSAGNQFNAGLTINHGGTTSGINTVIARNAGSSATITGNVVLNCTNTDASSGIVIANDGNVTVNGNITVSTTNGRGVLFGGMAGNVGNFSLGNGFTISSPAGSFVTGTLSFIRFTQVGGTPQTLNLTGTTSLVMGPSAQFGGNLNFVAPQIYFNGATYNGTTIFEKSGATDNVSTGGNTFTGPTTITNTGSGEIFMGNTTADTFNGTATFNNTGSYRIRIAYNHTGQTTTFASSVTLNTNKSGGVDPWSFLIAEGTDTHVLFGGNLTVNCAGSLRSDHRICQGTGSTATYSGTVTFNITNTNTGTVITPGVNGTSTYNGNIVVVNSGGAQGIFFNNGAGASSTLAATRTISIGGGGFASGTLSLPRFTQTGATTQTLNILSGTTSLVLGPASFFGGATDFRAPLIYLNGTTFTGPAVIEKNGAGGSGGTGGNIFSSAATLINSSSGVFRTNAGSTFNGVTQITNSGSADILLELTSGSTYNGDVTFTNTGTSNIRVGYQGTNLFNGNILVNSTNGTGINFCESTGTATLGATKTISIGASGFSTGVLTLRNFTQVGATPQTLTTFGGVAALVIGPGSSFDGNVNFKSPQIYFNGASYNGTSTLEKTGATDNASNGGNTFSGVTTITNTGSGEIYMGNGNADTFNAVTTFNNNGSYRIRIAHNHSGQTTTFATDLILNTNKSGGSDPWSFLIAENPNTNVSIGGNLTINCAGTLQSDHRFLNGTGSIGIIAGTTTINLTNSHASTVITMGVNGTGTYNGNIVVTNTSGANGIYFNTGASASSILAATRTVSIGGAGFNSGTLSLSRFTQVGATPQTLNTFSGTARLILGPTSEFDGNVDFKAPQVYLNGTTHNGTAAIEKSGATDNYANGGNVFNGVTTITNSGSGYLLTGGTNADLFNGVTTFNDTGTSRIYLAHNHTNQTTTFTTDVTFNSNKTAGSDANAYQISEGANSNLSFEGNVTINCGGTVQSDYRFLSGSGTTAVYGGILTVNLTNSHPSTSVTLGITGTSTYNSDIVVSNTSGASGIFFNSNTTATSTLASTHTISIGGGGFTGGTLSLIRFTQIGTTDQTLSTFSGTARLIVGPASAFGGNVDFRAPQLFLNGCLYSGTANLEKNGATDNPGTGGNTFNGVTTITNSGSGYLMTGNVSADSFNAVTTFNNIGSYRIFVAHNHTNQTTTFATDVTFSTNKTSGADTWSYFIGEGTNTNISFGGNVNFDCAGTLQSDHRILFGSGSTLNVAGTTTINITNTHPSTTLSMGVNGTSAYNNNIVVTNTGGANGIYFNTGISANATLAATRTITIGGAGFSGGTLSLIRFTQIGPTPQTLNTFSGTARLIVGPTSAFGGDVDFKAPQVYLNGCVYSGTAIIEKTGATDNYGSGGNTFNGVATLTTSGSGYFLIGGNNADTFNDVTTFNNNGSYRLYFAYNHPGQTTTFATDVFLNSNRTGGSDQWAYMIAESAASNVSFGGNVTINCMGAVRSDYRILAGSGTVLTYAGNVNVNVSNTHPSTAIYMGVTGTSTYNGNITVSNSAAANGIYFNFNPTATSTLAAGRTISIGAGGFTGGTLSLIRFTQLGATPQTLSTFSGTAALVVGPSSAFGGNVDFRAPQIYMNSAVYSGTANIEKNGAADNYSSGGNTFNDVTVITNNGSGEIFMGNTTADVFNALTTFNNTGTYRIRIAYNHTNQTTTFASDVILNSNKSGGVDPWSFLVCDGNATNISFGGNLTINIAGAVRSDHRFLNGSGTTATYGGTVTINNNTTSTVVTMGVSGISTYNGDIVVTNNTGANGIYFNSGATATSTLANGRTISIGGGGFSVGTLSLIRFTQLGTTPQTLTTFSGTSILVLGPTSAFGGNVNFRSPQVYLNGTVYNGTAVIEKSGATDNASTGGNTFNSTATVTNSGTGYLLLGNVTADTFNGATIFNNTGGYRFYFAYNHTNQTTTFGSDLTLNSNKTSGADQFAFMASEGTSSHLSIAGNLTINCAGTIRSDNRFLTGATTVGTYGGTVTVNSTNTNANTAVSLGVTGTSVYNGNIVVSNSGGSSGVFFNSGATATSSLAATRTISIGAGGFSAGTLSLPRFTQIGATAQTLNTFTGTATLISGPASAFGGDVNFVSPQLYLNGATYSGTAHMEKTGVTNNDNVGGNTFNGASTIVNSSIARFRLAGTNADTYNGSATFVKTSTGALEPAYNLTNTFAGNLSTNTNTVITLGAGTGVVEFTGGALQTVSKTAATSSPIFQRMRMNKTALTTVTLTNDVTIGVTATFTSGIMITSAGNHINFADNATATAANDLSYVDGPVRKTGNDIFTFPVGSGNFYRSIAITTTPGNAADHFTAQYFKAPQPFGGNTTWHPSFYTVSGCEYWILNRTNGTSNVTVTLSWNENACSGGGPVFISDPSDLRVTRWNGASWVNHGNGGTTGTNSNGTIVTAGTVNAFSPFTLASTTIDNPLPIELEKFWAENNKSTVTLKWITASEINNESFTLQRSQNGFDFETIYTVKGAGTSAERHYYNFTDDGPFSGQSYYKLIQTDYDGQSKSFFLSVSREGDDLPFTVSPNPAGNEIVTFSQRVSIVIFNSLSQVVGEKEETLSLDVTDLASGVYFIRNQKGQVARLVKK